jgi:hypothetical protein
MRYVRQVQPGWNGSRRAGASASAASATAPHLVHDRMGLHQMTGVRRLHILTVLRWRCPLLYAVRQPLLRTRMSAPHSLATCKCTYWLGGPE